MVYLLKFKNSFQVQRLQINWFLGLNILADILKLTPMTYVIVFGASLSNFASGLLEPTIAPYLQLVGLSYDMIGFVYSARFFMVSLLAVPFALFAYSIGIKRLLYLSGFVFILAGWGLIGFDGATGVFIFYFLLGLINSIFGGPGIAIIANNEPDKRITAFALYSVAWMIPTAFGALISAYWFININVYTVPGLKSIFYPTFIILIIGSLLFIGALFKTALPSIEESKNENDTQSTSLSVKKQFSILLTPAMMIPLFLIFFSDTLGGAGAGSTLPYLSPYLKNVGATPFQLSILVFVLWGGCGLLTQLTAPLSKLFGDLNVYSITTILSVVSLLGIVFSHDLFISATFYILRGIFANMSAPVLQNRLVGYINGEVRGLGLALDGALRWAGWSLFSPISGIIIELHGYAVSFTFTSIIYIIALLIFLWAVTKYDPLIESKPVKKLSI